MNAAEPIAIVGMSARVPGADDLDEFWRNLVDGVESVTHFTRPELIARGVPESTLDDPGYVAAAPVLRQIEYFDAGLFGMTPREAALADPQQRLFLEQAHAALVDAAYDPVRYDGHIGVYAGSGAPEYEWLNVRANARTLAGAGNLGIAVGNKSDYVATTVSYRLNLRGPSLTVHTACSTSLVAIHLACEALRGGECDLALAGGVCVELPHGVGYVGAEGYVSSDGHCRPFDAKANGTIWGSGVGAVVLKRLADAVADGDRVRAVVLGNAVNNDGAAKVGFSAPSVSGQVEVIGEALAVAGVSPRTVGYVEAHGTGTVLGDPIEVTALSTVYGDGVDERGWCALGSVKSNLGHLSHASGVVGVIKTVLALEHGLIPPSINYEQPNPEIDFAAGPFYVNAALSVWDSPDAPRRAGVSSFGIGGTNAHVVLEQAPPVAPRPTTTPEAELLTISARTPAALSTAVTALADRLASADPTELADIAYTLRVGRTEYPHRAAVVAADPAEAVAALRAPRKLQPGVAGDPPPPVTLLFSGQGAQYAGMGRTLYQDEPVFAAAVDTCADRLAPHLGLDLRPLLFGDDDAPLRQTGLTQPALFTLEYALAQLWDDWGVRPGAMIGHSIGEYVAATLAGVFTLSDALALVATRGRLMQSMPAGAMLAVQRGEADVAGRLPDGLSIAVVNGPDTCVVAGPVDAVEAFAATLRADGIGSTALRTSHAFHSAMMEPVLAEYTAAVAAVARRAPAVPFLSNVTGDWITDAQATDPTYWAGQLRQPVRFGACVATLVADPARAGLLLECGPGRQLAGLARMQLPRTVAAPLHSLPGPGEKTDDRRTMATAAGRLWVAGVPVRPWPARTGRRVALPAYPYERERFWVSPDADAPVAPARPLSTVVERPVDQWAEVPVWRQEPATPTGPAPERALVFVADDRGAAVAAALRAAGTAVTEVWPGSAFGGADDRWSVRPGAAEDYRALLAALGPVPTRVVHTWSVAGPAVGSDLTATWAAQEYGLFSLFALAQALAAAGDTTPAQLDVVTLGTEDVLGGDLTRPEHATVAGVVRVLALEQPSVRVRQLDLVATTTADDVVAELRRAVGPADDDPADLVALRGARRWRRGFGPVALAPAPVRAGERIVVTGGLGGLGLTIAADLATVAGTRIALLGRTGLPPRSEWDAHTGDDRTGRAVAAVRRMEAAGAEVLVLAADVTDPVGLRAARGAIEAAFGGVDVIVHAAGLPGGGMIEVRERSAVEAVLAPKLSGPLALHAAFGDLPVRLVLLCSSVTAVAGGFGQADYCAANAYLDAYARGDHGWPGRVVAVDWGGWLEVGMAAESTTAGALRALQDTAPVVSTVDHPILTARHADGSVSGEVGAATHWVLDEHRIAGVPVLPGTGHVECLRAAVDDGTGAVELRDVVFVRPLSVPDGSRATVRVRRAGENLTVVSEAGGVSTVHAQATGRTVDPGPASTVDLDAVRARCQPYVEPPGRTTTVTFGPRWSPPAGWLVGPDEELALIEAPAPAAADHWVLHPALLDVATAFGRSRGAGPYLPLSYGRLVVRAPLPPRFFSHLRYRDAGEEVITADLTLCDESGVVLVEISEFVLRRVDAGAVRAGLTGDAVRSGAADAVATGTDRDPGSTSSDGGTGRPGSTAAPGAMAAPGGTAAPSGTAVPGGTASGVVGIRPADGAEATRRLLAADLGPQVVVSAVALAAVVERERRLGRGEVESAGAPVGDAADATGDDLTRTLARIWSEVLVVSDVDADDDFFDLGGNSLVAVQLIVRVREAVGVRLPMRALFEGPTVAGMAALVEQLRAAEADAPAPTAAAEDAPIPRVSRVRPAEGGEN